MGYENIVKTFCETYIIKKHIKNNKSYCDINRMPIVQVYNCN